MDRDKTISRIRKDLKDRSGKAWSVKGGRGTAWGWITVDVPARREENRAAELIELAGLMGLDNVHHQGISIPSSRTYHAEYVDRAEGRKPAVVAKPYWD